MAFVFYDCETTGLDTTFDQILQFAAVVTDEDLNVIESLEVRCRLLPHIVPHPAALNVTRTALASISDPNLPSHYEMMRQVAKAFESWCPATFIGFNSHRFDEKLLHQAFYQTLHDPFVTSRPINGRADALTLCRSVAYFSPGVLEIPYGELAAPSFRLSDLSAANAGPAADHTAAADVQATLHLCRLIRERDPECWSRFLRFSSKRSVDAFLETEPAFGVVGFHGNAPKPTVATLLGAGCVDRNVRYLLDLTADLDKIASYDDDTLAALLPLNDSPVIRVRVNASTALCASYDLPNAMRVLISEDNEEVLVDRIRSDHRLGSRILQALRAAETPFARGTKIEQLVYGGLGSASAFGSDLAKHTSKLLGVGRYVALIGRYSPHFGIDEFEAYARSFTVPLFGFRSLRHDLDKGQLFVLIRCRKGRSSREARQFACNLLRLDVCQERFEQTELEEVHRIPELNVFANGVCGLRR